MWLLTLVLFADTAHAFSVVLTPVESVQVTVTGAGEPVVLIPGLFGSAFGFRRVLPLLAQTGFHAVVVEPLGVGTSARPARADYSLTAQADRVAAALDRLGLANAIVVAHAVGASIAYRLAYRRPDLVRGIVALDGGPVEAATTRGFRRALELAPWIKLLGGARLVRRKLQRSLIAASGDTTWVTEPVPRPMALTKICTSRAKSGGGLARVTREALGRHISAEAWAMPELLCLPCALACRRASHHPRLRVTYADLP